MACRRSIAVSVKNTRPVWKTFSELIRDYIMLIPSEFAFTKFCSHQLPQACMGRLATNETYSHCCYDIIKVYTFWAWIYYNAPSPYSWLSYTYIWVVLRVFQQEDSTVWQGNIQKFSCHQLSDAHIKTSFWVQGSIKQFVFSLPQSSNLSENSSLLQK